MWATKLFAQCASTWIAAAACSGCTQAALAQAVPASPDPDALPAPSSARGADIGAIASGFDAKLSGTSASESLRPRLLILVSFSMPPASLVRLNEQAQLAGGVLVFRGLKDDSLTATAAAVHQVFGKKAAPLQIDPRPFTRYEIRAVPAFILLPPGGDDPGCTAGRCSTDGFAKAVGDVSLDYALEQIAVAQPRWAPAATMYLRRLGR